MFEVGKTYEIKMDDGAGILSMVGTVEKYEHPLIKLRQESAHLEFLRSAKDLTKIHGEIVNVTSVRFVSAVEVDAPDIGELE